MEHYLGNATLAFLLLWTEIYSNLEEILSSMDVVALGSITVFMMTLRLWVVNEF